MYTVPAGTIFIPTSKISKQIPLKTSSEAFSGCAGFVIFRGNVLHTQWCDVTTLHLLSCIFQLWEGFFLTRAPFSTSVIESLHHSNRRMFTNYLTMEIEDTVIKKVSSEDFIYTIQKVYFSIKVNITKDKCQENCF